MLHICLQEGGLGQGQEGRHAGPSKSSSPQSFGEGTMVGSRKVRRDRKEVWGGFEEWL